MELNLELADRDIGVLMGLATSACLEATRDGRTGPWVTSVRNIVAAIEYAEAYASWHVHPKGGEAFGTRVTFWSESWGNRHAVITRSPRVESERDRFDPGQWQIVIAGTGMTHASAESLTLGWHPNAQGMDKP